MAREDGNNGNGGGAQDEAPEARGKEIARAEPDEEPESEGAPDHAPDVVLDVPNVSVDEIGLEVENLRARVSLQAEVLDLLRLNVGADVELGRVSLNITGVQAEALLKVRLDTVARILERVLTTVDRNPQIIEQVVRSVEPAVRGAGEAARELGKGSGEAVREVGGGAGRAVEGVGQGAGEALESVGEGAGEAAGEVGRGAGQAVEDVGRGAEEAGRGAGQAVEDVGRGAEEAGRGAGDSAREAVSQQDSGDFSNRPPGRRDRREPEPGRRRSHQRQPRSGTQGGRDRPT